ncbi:hypothetical protein X777_11269 [Ooceraea biroi]|nr:hypothetical protein X777_11269 [Ooceraea biroi]
MYDKGYTVLNSDTKSRLNYYNQVASNINLVFVNNDLSGLLEYNQLSDTWGSDHYPIEISFDIEVEPYRKLTNRVTVGNRVRYFTNTTRALRDAIYVLRPVFIVGSYI